MKSNYQKPMLQMESFSLTQTTAKDCADSLVMGESNAGDINSCVYDMGGGSVIFTQGLGTPPCTIDGNTMTVYCYNNPSEGHYIFHS